MSLVNREQPVLALIVSSGTVTPVPHKPIHFHLGFMQLFSRAIRKQCNRMSAFTFVPRASGG